MEVKKGWTHYFMNIKLIIIILVIHVSVGGALMDKLYRYKRFLLSDQNVNATLCCQCDDFTTDRKCSDICTNEHVACILPDICSTTFKILNGQLYEKTSCGNISTCIRESEQTFDSINGCDGLQRNQLSDGDTCIYCCRRRKQSQEHLLCVENRTFSRNDFDLLKTDFQVNLQSSSSSPPSTTVSMTTTQHYTESTTTALQTSNPTTDQTQVTCESCDVSETCVTKTCSKDESYCINFIEIDKNGSVTVLKKGCANYLECKFDHSSQGCIYSDGKASGYQTCELCCKATNNSEPCNKNAKPTNIEWFGDTTSTVSTTELTSTSPTTSTLSRTSFTTTAETTVVSTTLSPSSTTSQPTELTTKSITELTSSTTTELTSTDNVISESSSTVASTMDTSGLIFSATSNPTTQTLDTFSTVEPTTTISTPISSDSSTFTSLDSTSDSDLTTSSDLETPSTADLFTSSTSKPSTGLNILFTPSPKNTTTPRLTSTVIKTTTKKQPLTLSPKITICDTCSHGEALCEILHEPTNCEPPNNYCINKIVNKRNGDRDVNRLCGDFNMCYTDWFLGSSDNDKCRSYDENDVVTLDFSCTFCCTTDGCNAKLRPDDNTLYTAV